MLDARGVPAETSPLRPKKPQLAKPIADYTDTTLPVIPIPPAFIVPSIKNGARSPEQQSPSFKSLDSNISKPIPASPPPTLSLSLATTANLGTNESPERAPVVLRQRNGAAKGASHARDRRSFIEKDGVQNALDGLSEGFDGTRNRLMDQQQPQHMAPGTVSDDGLWNGAAPVCCVCNTKIQR